VLETSWGTSSRPWHHEHERDTLGFDWEANDFFYFIADVAENDEDQVQILYGIDGEDTLTEETLDQLSGYEGARPVRTGNAAYDQEQHDVWGALLHSVYLHTKSRDHLPERIWPMLKKQVGTAIEKWRTPIGASGKSVARPGTSRRPKLMCWVAADRGARLAEVRDEQKFAARWQSAAERSTPTSWRTRSTTPASSASTTTPTPSTPRFC
jgi:GH15 family glucan-1,4-alpha-glucosidase